MNSLFYKYKIYEFAAKSARDVAKSYPNKQRKSFPKISNSKVFRLRSQLCEYIFEEAGLSLQDLTKLGVIEELKLVQIRQLFTKGNSFFPHLV